MADQTLVALNRALMRAYRLLGREGLRQYLALSLEALDVQAQIERTYDVNLQAELMRQLEAIIQQRRRVRESQMLGVN